MKWIFLYWLVKCLWKFYLKCLKKITLLTLVKHAWALHIMCCDNNTNVLWEWESLHNLYVTVFAVLEKNLLKYILKFYQKNRDMKNPGIPKICTSWTQARDMYIYTNFENNKQ